jgi:hypothetical protein
MVERIGRILKIVESWGDLPILRSFDLGFAVAPARMKILLRNAHTGHYYAGPGKWVPERAQALNLKQIERAIRLNSDENIGATDMVLAYEKPPCVLTLPISPKDQAAVVVSRLPAVRARGDSLDASDAERSSG